VLFAAIEARVLASMFADHHHAALDEAIEAAKAHGA